MKPAPFVYSRAGSVEEAVAVLAEQGDEVRVLAGGQSLIPMMNLRIARPDRILDIGPITTLNRLGTDGGQLIVGALVPHAVIESHPAIRATVPVLARAASHIGHAAIRRRGTIGGSFAHADPSAELIAVGMALGASVALDAHRGRRVLALAQVVAGPYETVIRSDELLTWVSFPVPATASRTGFYEVAPREGDFATAGAVWHADEVRTRVAVFGADVGQLVVELGRDVEPSAVVDELRSHRSLSGLAARRLHVAVSRAAEDARVALDR